MNIRAFASVLALCVALPFAAVAGEPSRSATISMVKFDLSAPESVAQLHREIVVAAGRVCRDQDGRGIELMKMRRACMRTAVDAAIAGSQAPTLVALADTLGNVRYSARAYQLTPTMVAAVEKAAGRQVVAGF